jgi:hypothetical protein
MQAAAGACSRLENMADGCDFRGITFHAGKITSITRLQNKTYVYADDEAKEMDPGLTK